MYVRQLNSYTHQLVIAVLLVLAVVIILQRDRDPLSLLNHVAESAGRTMDRDMAFYESYAETSQAQRWMHAFLFGSRKQVMDKSISMCHEVLAYFNRKGDHAEPWAVLNTQARLLVLLAESKRWREFSKLSAELSQNPEEDALQGAIRFAYGKAQDERGLLEIQYGARLIPLGWTSQKVNLLLADRMGDKRASGYFQILMQKNAREVRSNLNILLFIVVTVMVSGVLLFFQSKKLQAIHAWPDGILAEPWPLKNAALVFVVSIALAIPILYFTQSYSGNLYVIKIFNYWKTLVLFLPLLLGMHYYLLKPKSLNFISGFNLLPGNVPLSQLVGLILILVTLDWFGSSLIAFLVWQLGLNVSWTEGVHETSLFGSSLDLSLSSVELLVWAPVIEEIVYRGLIYVSLRAVFTPNMALVLSAFIFALLHFYSPAGFLVVFWSGLLLAYSYQRFHSLLPGIFVHAAGNTLHLTTIWLFYR